MPDFRILWTALPRGAGDDHLLVDVFVSPRLGIDEAPGSTFELADFPVLASWPDQVADHLCFELKLEPAGEVVPATRVSAENGGRDVDLDATTWERLFPSETPVKPWTRRSIGDRDLYSFPAGVVAGYVQNRYYDAGNLAGLGPVGDDYLGAIVEDLGDLIDTRPEVERAEPISVTSGGETIGGGPPPTTTPQGCLSAPLAWLVWLLRWLWHAIAGGPPPGPTPHKTGPEPPPVSVTPKVVTYLPAPRPPAKVPPALEAIEQHVQDEHVTPKAGWTPGRSLSSDKVALACAWRFYQRPESRPHPTVIPPRPDPPEWDFHQRLGVLGDYPRLLRRLGIVIRLSVPRPAVNPCSVRIIPRWDGQRLPQRDLTPPTLCTLEGNVFRARTRERPASRDRRPEPRDGSSERPARRSRTELRDGVLDLTGATDRNTNDLGFRFVVVDAEGALLKLVHTAASLVRYQWLRERGLVRSGTRAEGLAALQTGGIALVQEDRAWAIKEHLTHLDDNAPRTGQDAPKDVSAEDIFRGFQVQVQRVLEPEQVAAGVEPEPWLSLCEREGTYYVLDDDGTVLDTFPLVDTGYVKRSAATSADAVSSPLYVHEALVRWTGWSLVAPRPGRRITTVDVSPPESDRPVLEERVVLPVPEPHEKLHLATVFRPASQSLPTLRFGVTYRFRLPWVDLAGEAVDRPESAPESGDVTYRRFEPLAPPALVPLCEFTEGESLECLVIRSDLKRNAADYVEQVLEPLAGDVDYSPTANRHVFPAKVTQEQAEQHGAFDPDPTRPHTSDRLAWAWEASLRADNTLLEPSATGLVDPETTVFFGQPRKIDIPPPPPPQGSPTPAAGSPAPAEETQGYVVNAHDGIISTPYLPDPLASGVALLALPGARPGGGDPPALPVPAHPDPVCVCHVAFTGDWPELESFRIRVADRPGTLDPETGVESFVSGRDPPQWDPAARVLTVFLARAEVAHVAFSTLPDETRLDWLGTLDWLDVDDSSDVHAYAKLGCHWLVSPARTLTLVHAVQQPLAPAALARAEALKKLGATVAAIGGRMQLDRASTGHVTLLASWTDEVDTGSGALVQETRSAVLSTFAVPSGPASLSELEFPPPVRAEVPVPAEGAVAAVEALHELGDTKHRHVTYRLKATTRFREYFPAELADVAAAEGTGDAFSRVDGDGLVVPVENSAPPDAPSVRYLVPSFGWDVPDPIRPEAWTRFRRVRGGGGIRVFLDRPWRTSGPGEQLGVVVPRPATALPELLRSQIGADPTWSDGSEPRLQLEASMFRGGTVHDAVLEDGTKVHVVGYDPELDTDRNQWHADISLDMASVGDAYCPFVRLALVRFQPTSVERAAASKVVLSEFAQLAPDRELLVEVVGSQVKVVVTGVGPSELAPDALYRPTANWMLIALEEADGAAGGPDPDELAWRQVGLGADAGLEERSGQAVRATPAPAAPRFRWERTLALPGPRGDRLLRVVVRELELRDVDPEVSDDRYGDMPAGVVAEEWASRERLPRIVYADSVRLA